ncbi:OmpA family protein [Isoptericola halotolerans]|uniref:OmpA family protein n=1 Tax=Isoptericola halotolerans TaxID=300560 RepID=UPI00388DC8C1
MHRGLSAALVVVLAGLSAGCGLQGSGTTDPPARSATSDTARPAPGATTSTGGAHPAGEVVAVEREWHGVQVQLAVRPVETTDDVAVLRYDLAATRTDGPGPPRFSSVALALGELGASTADGRGVRLVDYSTGLVHPVARTPGGGAAAVVDRLDDDGDTVRGSAVAVFAAPAGASVDVLLPALGAVTVPVVVGGADVSEAVDRAGGADEATTHGLRAFTQDHAATTTTSAQDDDLVVTLASDVLFDPDEHTLSDAARSVVDQAADSILEQADAGQVHVVGHTDDVDTEAYNQGLSERRASSVADRLRERLGGDVAVTQEGRGESEPVVDGSSPADRAANRRVEIRFHGRLVVEHQGRGDDQGRVALPTTDAPTAQDAPVTVVTDAGDYRVEVRSVVRRPDALVGTLVAERVSGDSIDPAWFLPANLRVVGDRRFGTRAEAAGPHNLSLLTPGERILPFDYEGRTPSGEHALRRLLGDEEVSPLDRGETVLVTVVWPETGQDTVTVDAPDRFRITDVPVTDASTTDPSTGD